MKAPPPQSEKAHLSGAGRLGTAETISTILPPAHIVKARWALEARRLLELWKSTGDKRHLQAFRVTRAAMRGRLRQIGQRFEMFHLTDAAPWVV